jgi:class 3 adenylate cyclase/outer membrane lipoprotein-sorting protein/tRNA A-37 threonylcarbamoyl transferase component Bud32
MELPLQPRDRARVEEFQHKHRIALLTMLFTDIASSTRLKQDLGDTEAVNLIRQHHALVRELIGQFAAAAEINTAGDSCFVIFAKPSDAVKFSLLLQLRLRDLNQNNRHPVRDRIGIHVGEVFVEHSGGSRKPIDLYGLQVDSTARVMSLAQPDQILMSRFVFDNARQILKGQDIGGTGRISWLNHGPYMMKGVEEPIEICEAGETGIAPLIPPPNSEKAHRHISIEGEPVLGWRPAVEQVVPNTKWILEEKLGEGGFGEVWLGRHETLREKRVFKFCFRADRVRSLKREVTLFRLLKERVGVHPNIVGIQDVYFDEPPYYIMMDYAEGKDLGAWIEAQGGIENIPTDVRLEIVAQIADALYAAHQSEIIHRDVKPSNMLIHVDPAGALNVKLTDFGIGQVVSEEALAGLTKMGFTQTMVFASQSGTQMYMAPELVARKPATPQSDIYSLGVVLYQLLMGDLERPLTTDWMKNISDPLLRDDLAKCFAGNPDERFKTAKEMAENLRSLEARRAALQARKIFRRRIFAVAACLAIAAFIGFKIISANRAAREARLRAAAIENLGAAYENFSTYQDEFTMQGDAEIAGLRTAISGSGTLLYARPNKVKQVLRGSFGPVEVEIQVICDGKKLWIYSPASRQYIENDAPATIQAIAIQRGVPWMANAALMHGLYDFIHSANPRDFLKKRAPEVAYERDDVLQGKPVYVFKWNQAVDISWRSGDGAAGKVENKFLVPVKVFATKSEGLFLQLTTDLSSLPPDSFKQLGVSMRIISATETHRNLMLNEPVADKEFAFVPPPNASRVSELSIKKIILGLSDFPRAYRDGGPPGKRLAMVDDAGKFSTSGRVACGASFFAAPDLRNGRWSLTDEIAAPVSPGGPTNILHFVMETKPTSVGVEWWGFSMKLGDISQWPTTPLTTNHLARTSLHFRYKLTAGRAFSIRLEPGSAGYEARTEFGKISGNGEWQEFSRTLSSGSNLDAFLNALANEDHSLRLSFGNNGNLATYSAGDSLELTDIRVEYQP